jgi:hypothetical protein
MHIQLSPTGMSLTLSYRQGLVTSCTHMVYRVANAIVLHYTFAWPIRIKTVVLRVKLLNNLQQWEHM